MIFSHKEQIKTQGQTIESHSVLKKTKAPVMELSC